MGAHLPRVLVKELFKELHDVAKPPPASEGNEEDTLGTEHQTLDHKISNVTSHWRLGNRRRLDSGKPLSISALRRADETNRRLWQIDAFVIDKSQR